MTARPILFRAPMVRALLAGTKTQTRRIMKPQPYADEMGNACWKGVNFGQSASKVPHFQSLASPLPSSKTGRVHCPYGKPGDTLWVRETWAPHPQDEKTIFYRVSVEADKGFPVWSGPWKPSIHMPRWASRITLEVTSVRVERLQDISEADAIAEGITPYPNHFGRYLSEHRRGLNFPDAVAVYRDLWESINGIGSWDANPWVWVVEFRRLV